MNSYNGRYERLRSYMTENGIDAVYVNSPENILYMSGYNNPDGHMLITADNAYFYNDFRYIEAATAESFDCVTVVNSSESSLFDVVKSDMISKIALEDKNITLSDYTLFSEKLSELGASCVCLGDTFTELRAIKDETEIESIVAAQRIAEEALSCVLGMINYDMTEIELAAELEYQMKKRGSEMPAFDTIAVSGSASSRPHGVPRPTKLERGFLTMDFGAKKNGYCSDMTRTVVIGKADAEMRRLYETVLRAQIAAEEFVAEGADCGEVDRVARDIIYSAGYEGCFGHGLGHGVGLLIHELPNQNMRSFGRRLVKGNIVTVEPGIYIAGRYGCRIEDMMAIGENGAVNLTKAPRELIEI